MNKRLTPSCIHFRFFTKSLLFSLGCLLFGLTSALQADPYSQAYLKSSSDSPSEIEAIPLEVTGTGTLGSPQITITTYAAGTYTISRKDPSVDTWIQLATGVSLGILGTWTDNTVAVGTMYEYQFVNTASTPTPGYSYDPGKLATGYILTGIQVDQTQPKGMMAVIVANDLPVNLPIEYAQYKADLVADGWQVREIQVPRCPDAYTALGNGAISSVTINNNGLGFVSGTYYAILANPASKLALGQLIAKSGTISSITIPQGGAGAGFAVSDPLTLYYTSGMPVTAAVITPNIDPTQAQFDSASTSAGTGYINGESATLTGNTSGKTAQVTLTVISGTLRAANVVSSGTGFTIGETLTLSGGSGSGAGSFTGFFRGPIQSLTVVTGGTNYVNGNLVNITQPVGSGTSVVQGILTVTSGTLSSIALSGSSKGLFINGVQAYLSGLASVGILYTGSNYNLTVGAINNSNTGRLVTIGSGGSGYTDNDTVTITSGTLIAKGSLIAPSGTVTGISVVLPNTFTVGATLTLTATSGGSGATATVGASNDNQLLIRSAVQAIYNAYPGQLKNIVMVGKVPVCRSGINDVPGADGHGDECPYGADAFYAEMLGKIGVDWTDTQSNVASQLPYLLSDFNLPGDNQFDQQKISQINLYGTGKVQLGFGRIDLSLSMLTEIEAERNYFNKLHRYKTADPTFLPGRKVCDRIYSGQNTLYSNVHESCIGSMPGVVGMSNIDFVSDVSLPAVPASQDPDQLYSTLNGPFLFYFKAYWVPLSGVNGKAVFWTNFKSFSGQWYQGNNNNMQERLAENSFTLDYTWDIGGLRYLYHRMGMGMDAGDMMKQSINNQGYTTGPYTYKDTGYIQGDFHGTLYMDQMGDPSLRLFMFAPPTGLSIVKTSGNPVLTWTASTDNTVTGYHVYRAANTSGSFTRLTTLPVSGTTFTDSSVSTGSYVYMVRGTRLEATGGGSYLNASLGITQSINLNAASTPVSISTTSLSTVSWNTATTLTLSGSGGYPQYSWVITSGTLPAGLTLSTAGVISGTTQATGNFSLTVQATDQTGQTASQALTLTVSQNSQSVIYPTWTTLTDKSNPTASNGANEDTRVSGISNYMFETFHRYDLSGLNLSNGLAKATLYLYVTQDSLSTLSANALIQTNLIADAVDGWVANGNAAPFSSAAASPTSGWTRINCPNHGLTNGTLVTLAGLTGFPSTAYAITVIDANNFDIHIAYGSWVYTSSSAFVTTTSMIYNNRPTTYDTNVPTLTGSGSDTPGTLLQFDVTSYVNEVMSNFPDKQMGIRFFTGTPQTVAFGSLNSFGASIPYLVIQSTNAPKIVVNSPTVNPAYISAGSGILLSTTVTPLFSRAGSLILQWSQVAGPGTTTFTNPTSAVTGASFSAPGTYMLQLTANDGVETSSQILTITSQNNPLLGPTDNLILRLPFDEFYATSGTIAHDVSGVSPANNGTLTSTTNTLPTWSSSGKVVGALSFSGSGDQVVVPDSTTNLLDGMSQLSVSLWVNPSVLPVSSGTQACLIAKQIAFTNADSYAIQLQPVPVSGSTSAINCSVNSHGTSTTTRIPANTWSHVVMVFDGTQSNNLLIYINGNLDTVFSTPPSGPPYTSVPRNSTSSLHIGAPTVNRYSLPFNGRIDEVRIYKRVLTFPEIQALAQAAPSEVGPIITTSLSLSGSIGYALPLTATVSSTSSSLSYSWSELSGPIQLTIASPTSLSTSTTPSVSGSFGLSFAANDGAITTFANIAASITDTYNNWAARNSLTGNNALMTTVVANDGFTNLFKYALGLNPATHYNGGSAGLPSVAVQNNYLALTFNGVANDVTYKVQASSDLVTWTTIRSFASGGVAPGLQTVQDSQLTSAYTKRFMRLLISNP